MVRYGIQILAPSSYRWKKVGQAVGHQANPLAQALKTASATGAAGEVIPRVYSIPEEDPRFCSESVLTRFVSQLCCYSSDIFRNGHFISIQTAQHSTNDRKIHLFTLGCFFVLILGDKPKKKKKTTYVVFIICSLHSLH